MEEKDLITIAEAMRLTGFSRQTIMRRIAAKDLHPQPWKRGYKKGARVGIPRSEVEALLRR